MPKKDLNCTHILLNVQIVGGAKGKEQKWYSVPNFGHRNTKNLLSKIMLEIKFR